MLNISAIPAFQDNYIWLLHAPDSQQAAVVDPGDAAPVLRALQQQNLQLAAIYITHHHGDHTGGIMKLLSAYPHAHVYGPAGEPIRGVSHQLKEGDTIPMPDSDIQFKVLDVPGHTRGHIAYYGAGALFCGDTLFACGCGRLFEGTPEQMQTSLAKFLALPANTMMYCAHEYTLDNIAFAKWVEPENAEVLQREQDAHALIDADQPTLPASLELEQKTNPFLRFDQPEVIAAAERFAGKELTHPADVFAAVRHWKDTEFD